MKVAQRKRNTGLGGPPERKIRVRRDIEDLGPRDVDIQVGRAENDVRDLRARGCKRLGYVVLDAQLLEGGRQDVGATAVGDKMDSFDPPCFTDGPNCLLEVGDGKLP